MNNNCTFVPGVYGNVSYSLTGMVKTSGGVVGGPGVAETGATLVAFKADYIAADIMLNGDSQGRWFWYADYGDEVFRINMGKYGCTQIGDGYFLGPCISDPND